ncbi:2-hydroxyglutaryl-CoA dehydratase [Planctomycetales bacterium]|nr:2-hydroxyglutaryl-CoA dehydratase [Planctomycetales bacterium]
MLTVAITTTIPAEVIFAAGGKVVDLNNVFIADADAAGLVETAERAGLPANTCAWVKGLYATAHRSAASAVVGVVEGDCSPNAALLDLLADAGMKIIPFAYPRANDYAAFDRAIGELETVFGVTRAQTEAMKKRFDAARRLVKIIDDAAWQKMNIPSGVSFAAQLLTTDMLGDLDRAAAELTATVKKYAAAAAGADKTPLAAVGVPTMIGDLWDVIENAGGRVVYHEVPHQFSRADFIGADVVETYRHFTYPANARRRLAEIVAQCEKRRARGIVHYVQSFCHRQLHDLLLRRAVDLPVLTIEADRPALTDGRNLTRIEAFLEQLR